MKPTKNQQQVIDHQGSNILVSASAGSGKTSTMVNRVLKMIEDDNHTSIDDLLIITFTRASAADMREKLENSLTNAAKVATGDKKKFLEEQILKLPSANISTFDSFAQTIIEEYYDTIGIDPKFRLVEAGEIDLLNQEVLDQTINQFYQLESNQSFIELVKNFGSLKNINQFKKTVNSITNFVRTRSDGIQWLEKMPELYSQTSQENFYNETIQSELKDLIEASLKNLDQAIDKSQNSTEKSADQIRDLLTKQRETIQSFEIKDFKATKSEILRVIVPLENEYKIRQLPKEDDLKEAKKTSGDILTNLKSIYQDFFLLDKEKIDYVHLKSQELVETLTDFVIKYLENLEIRKSNDRILDFADLELKAHQILKNDEVAKDIQSKFAEVLVDEYQDLNRLQDEIVTMVTNGKNRFMVGDIKQSIYSFRQANPDQFADYFKNYENNQGGKLISLSENFRSDANILMAINQIFKQIMSEDFGGIDYIGDAELIAGLETKNDIAGPNVQLKIINQKYQEKSNQSDESQEDSLNLEDNNFQLDEVKKSIKRLIKDGYQYSQIAILTRDKNDHQTIINELNDAGIPVVADNGGEYFNRFEISILKSFLQVIDNPLNDIALVAVLRSPIFNLTANQLVELRKLKTNSSQNYFDLINLYLKGDPDSQLKNILERFVELLNKYQQLANQNLISDLIFEIYKDTGWLEYVAGLNDGIQRQANLQAFFQYAQNFQKTNFIGLHYFMNYINLLTESNKDLESAKIKRDVSAVQLMTIHKSKGLEFEAVICLGLNKNFNFQDQKAAVLLDKEFGIGINFVNPISNVRTETWPRHIIKQHIQTNQIAEEMRTLYVALTRAKEQLVLIGTAQDTKKSEFDFDDYLLKVENYQQTPNGFLPFELVNQFKNYFEMILYSLAAAKAKGQRLLTDIQIIVPEQTTQTKETIEKIPLSKIEKIDAQQLETIKDYAYTNLENELSKVSAFRSVSELKRINDDPDNFQLNNQTSNSQLIELSTPEFFEDQSKMAANLLGLAVHAILERVNYQAIIDEQAINQIITKLIEQNIFDKKTADAIDKQQLIRFFNSDFAKQLIEFSDNLHREESFAMLVPANQLEDTNQTKPILVKGTIDGYYLDHENKTITVFDYKTNSIKNGVEEIIDRYTSQLTWYGRALESMYPDYQLENKILIILADTKQQIYRI